jgi:hypothetical protein
MKHERERSLAGHWPVADSEPAIVDLLRRVRHILGTSHSRGKLPSRRQRTDVCTRKFGAWLTNIWSGLSFSHPFIERLSRRVSLATQQLREFAFIRRLVMPTEIAPSARGVHALPRAELLPRAS